MAEHGHAAISGSTVFPQQLGLGATRDSDLAERVASVAATEMRATGVHATSSPIGDVARDARWGRMAETFGESPVLCGDLTAAMVRGYQYQSQGSEREAVLAVTKHFPAYSEPVRGEDQVFPSGGVEYTGRLVSLVEVNHLSHPTLHHEAHRPSYDPLFEYGHGFSYTEFDYEDLAISPTEVGPDDAIDVSVTIANTGERSGAEVVEVFSTDVLSSRVTPVRELQTFERVDLDVGERTTVSFALDVREMGVVENDGTRTVEPGTLEIRVEDLVEEFDVARNRPYRR